MGNDFGIPEYGVMSAMDGRFLPVIGGVIPRGADGEWIYFDTQEEARRYVDQFAPGGDSRERFIPERNLPSGHKI